MLNLTDFPLFFFGFSLAAFWSSARVGALWRARHRNLEEEVRDFFAIILGAALTLLGLIIAFTSVSFCRSMPGLHNCNLKCGLRPLHPLRRCQRQCRLSSLAA